MKSQGKTAESTETFPEAASPCSHHLFQPPQVGLVLISNRNYKPVCNYKPVYRARVHDSVHKHTELGSITPWLPFVGEKKKLNHWPKERGREPKPAPRGNHATQPPWQPLLRSTNRGSPCADDRKQPITGDLGRHHPTDSQGCLTRLDFFLSTQLFVCQSCSLFFFRPKFFFFYQQDQETATSHKSFSFLSQIFEQMYEGSTGAPTNPRRHRGK